ncbi:unnamed protein product [Clavelina lepadiformis]|uniref:Uncharacterized protein n=1 Tax=Clavelina lepadiformis TaxID=159417 RepID=A0ABP0F1G4_CLALP
MAEVSTTTAVYDQVGNPCLESSSLRPTKMYDPKPKTPPPSPKKVGYSGVNDKVSDKHKNFKRRDTPRALSVKKKSHSYKPGFKESFEEVDEMEGTS